MLFKILNNYARINGNALDYWCTSICYRVSAASYRFNNKICIPNKILQDCLIIVLGNIKLYSKFLE